MASSACAAAMMERAPAHHGIASLTNETPTILRLPGGPRDCSWQIVASLPNSSSWPIACRENQIKMVRLLSVTSPALIPYSQDSDSIEREIETIERELSGCRRRDDEFTSVIVTRRPLNGAASRMPIALLILPGLCA